MDFFFLVGFRRLFRRLVLRRTGVLSRTAIAGNWDGGGSAISIPIRARLGSRNGRANNESKNPHCSESDVVRKSKSLRPAKDGFQKFQSRCLRLQNRPDMAGGRHRTAAKVFPVCFTIISTSPSRNDTIRCKKMLQEICRFTSRHCVLLPKF